MGTKPALSAENRVTQGREYSKVAEMLLLWPARETPMHHLRIALKHKMPQKENTA